MLQQGILKGKYHCTINLLFDWFGLVCFANKNKIVSCHSADTKPVKQEVNGKVILPPLVFPGFSLAPRFIVQAFLGFSLGCFSNSFNERETQSLRRFQLS